MRLISTTRASPTCITLFQVVSTQTSTEARPLPSDIEQLAELRHQEREAEYRLKQAEIQKRLAEKQLREAQAAKSRLLNSWSEGL